MDDIVREKEIIDLDESRERNHDIIATANRTEGLAAGPSRCL